MISFGQRLQFRGDRSPYAFWNHAAIYVGNGELIEAKGHHKVQRVPLSQYDVRHYAVIHFNLEPGDSKEVMDAMRYNSVQFCEAKLGNGYGYWTILSLVLWSLTGGGLTLGLGSSFICSGLAAESTERFGETFDRDIDGLCPAHLAEHFGIETPIIGEKQ
jgi:hypothetical protein